MSIPYSIPTIKTEADFANVVYINPDYTGGDSDGTIEKPFTSVPTFTPNTAYLIKRGTLLEQSINRVFSNVLLGAYGEGAMPIVKTIGEQAIRIARYSHNAVVRDIHFTASGTSPYGNGIGAIGAGAEHLWQDTENITVAFCKIIGNTDGTGSYPRGGFGISGKNIIVFNNEFSHCRTNFTGLQGEDLIIVRNWWHNTAKGSEPPGDTGTGDAIISQSMYNDLNNVYFAGNFIDVSNKTDKYAVMLNYSASSERMNDFIFEYNTIYSNKEGRGGTGLRWAVGPNSIGRKNLISAIHPSGEQLVHNMSYWAYNNNFSEPYGVRDNHFIQTEGRSVVGEGSEGDLISNNSYNNLRFGSWADYNIYLSENPETGLYGSDIDPDTFLTDLDVPGEDTGNPINITIVGQGSVAKSPDKALYETGESVILTPTPLQGWEFSHWSGDISGTTNPVNLTMNSNKTITATFTEINNEGGVIDLTSYETTTVTPLYGNIPTDSLINSYNSYWDSLYTNLTILKTGIETFTTNTITWNTDTIVPITYSMRGSEIRNTINNNNIILFENMTNVLNSTLSILGVGSIAGYDDTFRHIVISPTQAQFIQIYNQNFQVLNNNINLLYTNLDSYGN